MALEEEQLKEKYMQFQLLQQQVEQVKEHVETLHQQNVELDASLDTVQEIGKTKLNNEILAPIANGIFIKAGLKDNKKMIVNVGSDVTIEKTIPEIVQLLEKHKEKLVEQTEEAENILQQLQTQMVKIYKQIETKAGESSCLQN